MGSNWNYWKRSVISLGIKILNQISVVHYCSGTWLTLSTWLQLFVMRGICHGLMSQIPELSYSTIFSQFPSLSTLSPVLTLCFCYPGNNLMNTHTIIVSVCCLRSQITWILIPALPFISSVPLGKLFNLQQFSQQ